MKLKIDNCIALFGSTVVSLGVLCACEDVESEDVLMGGISADYEARTGGDGNTKITGVLRVGNVTSLTFLELTGDDKLIAKLGETEQELTLVGGSAALDAPSYTTSFSSADAVGAEVNIAFNRTVDAGGPISVVTVQPNITLTAPVAAAPLSRAADFDVVADRDLADGETGNIGISGLCIQGFNTAVAGATTTIQGNSLKKAEGDDVPDSCDVDINVSYTMPGTIDAAFGEGGRYNAVQARSVKVNSGP